MKNIHKTGYFIFFGMIFTYLLYSQVLIKKNAPKTAIRQASAYKPQMAALAWKDKKEAAEISANAVKKVKDSIAWASIPAGTFAMGSPADEVLRNEDETRHKVKLSAFKMSKYDVTFAQYDLFCEATGRKKPDDEGWGRGNRPVIYVSLDDANAFADWVGCRLPTEAEWEYACRAGTTTTFYTGNNLTTDQANYAGDCPYDENASGKNRAQTMPVGSFAPNAWGLYDMHGNVYNWCSDWYGKYSENKQTNPKGDGSGSYCVVRGGSWFSCARYCRSACRQYYTPDNRRNYMGFRLAL